MDTKERATMTKTKTKWAGTPPSKRLPSLTKYLGLSIKPPDRSFSTKRLSGPARKRVRDEYVILARARGVEVEGKARTVPNPRKPGEMLCIKGFLELNDQRRDLLAAAIFVVENEIESKGGGQRHHPTVEALNAIRNRIYDDIGGNE
jgi:hypothetical protein